MPHLREALALARALPVTVKLPRVPVTVVATASLPGLDGPDTARPGKNYNLTAGRLLKKVLAGGELSWRELRDAAWCLWTTEPALIKTPTAFHSILHAMQVSNRRQPARALASSYMACFGPDLPGVDIVARTLAALAQRMGEPWAELQEKFGIFLVLAGPRKVGAAAIAAGISPTRVLRQNGLSGFDAQSGFGKACAASALRELGEGSFRAPHERLELVRKIAIEGERSLIFQDHAPLVANALVIPFGSEMPEKSVRDQFLALLLGLFGDPRLKPGGWTRMPDAEAIVRKWLTEQSLRQFLDVVDKVALERMWKYRRAFWEAVYRAKLISDAWVVFDRRGVAEARRAFGKTVSFAQFLQGAGQVQQGQAVLLLRIGRGVVAEWSHNGRCNIWSDADDPSAPKLHRSTYPPDSLRSPRGATDRADRATFSVAHMGADTYRWQQKVAAKIQDMSNARIPTYTYQIR